LCVLLCVADAQDVRKNRFSVSRAGDPEYFKIALALEDDYFDGRDSPQRVRRHMQTAKEAGAKHFRCAFSWNGMEPERGRFNWKFWDMLVQEAERQGLELIPYVAYTPDWAARSKEDFWTQPPREFGWYAEVLRAAVTRYKGRVHTWEIWNEPDLQEYWRGSAEEFVELVKVASAEIRDADPNAIIVLGGMSRGPAEFYRKLHAAGIEKYVDVVAMHAYPESWDHERAESVYYDRVAEMWKLMQQSGPGDDLWINEAGYADYRETQATASKYGTPVYFAYEHTAAYQAEFLFKSMTMAMGGGKASLFGWYRVDDFRHGDTRMPSDLVHYHLGVTDVNGKRKPAFYAFRNFSRLFSQPVKPVHARAVSSAGERSMAVQEVFEDRQQRMVFVGWLRSLEPEEAVGMTGVSQDKRGEELAIALPCTSARDLTRISAVGNKLHDRTMRFDRGTLRGVRLNGDKVFIATFQCERD
jgi:hypothetical protein